MISLAINLLHVGGNGEGLGIYSGTGARGQCLVLRVEKWQLVNEDHAGQSEIRPSEFIGGQLFFKKNARKKLTLETNLNQTTNRREKNHVLFMASSRLEDLQSLLPGSLCQAHGRSSPRALAAARCRQNDP